MISLNNIYIHGRYYYDGNLHLYNTASGIEFNFRGKTAHLSIKAEIGQLAECWLRVIIDNDDKNALDVKFGPQNQEICLFSKEIEENHNIKVFKVSEAIESHVCINDLKIDGVFLDRPVYDYNLLVIGDSTVSAYGNLGSIDDEHMLDDTDGLHSFASITARMLELSPNILSGSGWGLAFSPWTEPKRASIVSFYDKVAVKTGIDYDMKQIKPKLAIISLGTNDSYYIAEGEDGRTKTDLISEFKLKYHDLLGKIKNDFGDIPILMLYGLMKERHNYDLMHQVYLDNKDYYNLYEVLLEGDGKGISAHPSASSHRDIACKLVKLIKEIDSE